MQLKILLPFKILLAQSQVLRIVAETSKGSFGLLPHRLDCVATLVPSILIYHSATDGEKWVAIDEGILIKTGSEVFISVRRALISSDLRQLHELVEQEYQSVNEEEQSMRSVMAKLESGFLRRFSSFDQQ
ncbi:F0F1 ATP synthase subunit epsilon [Flavobacterium sp. W21_SRS_FM6]|uniref:F0F1 ATP synthase subunit epsilon n=1 Tax=Flavobacterium sp. W21_SRS_FM6 TaxID=3240268 RepID=UPI003F8DE2B6